MRMGKGLMRTVGRYILDEETIAVTPTRGSERAYMIDAY